MILRCLGLPSPRYGDKAFVQGYGSFGENDLTPDLDPDTTEFCLATKVFVPYEPEIPTTEGAPSNG